MKMTQPTLVLIATILSFFAFEIAAFGQNGPTAEIITRSFIDDTSDGESSLEKLKLRVGGDRVTHYSYKVGLDSETQCDQATRYSRIAKVNKQINARLHDAANGDEFVLCLRGFQRIRDKQAKRNQFRLIRKDLGAVTIYRWTYVDENVDPAPGAFNITGPLGTIANDAPTVTWTASSNATSYQVIVATDAACTNIVDGIDTAQTSFTTQSLSDGAYFTCVFASNAVGQTAATNNGLGFQVDTAPPAPDAFSITGPTGVIGDQTPQIAWQASSNAATYNLILARDNACTNVVVSQNAILGTSFDITLPLDEGDYYSCVSATNVSGTVEASNNGLAFTIDIATPPGPFFITAPTETIQDMTPVVSWTASANADTYEVTIATDSACASVVTNGATTSTSFNVTAFLPVGSYFTCVAAENSAGTLDATNTGLPFTVLPEAPNAFSITAPTGLSNSPITSVVWTASSGADSYDVEIATNASCTAVVADVVGVTGTSVQDILLPDGTYFTCVTANNAGGSTVADNSGLMFSIDTVGPGEFDIEGPNGSTFDSTPLVNWTQAPGAIEYVVSIATDSECLSPVQVALVNALEFTASELVNGSYYACVTGRDAAGNETAATNDGLEFSVENQAPSEHLVFVTNAYYNIDADPIFPPETNAINGLRGADWQCTLSAFVAGHFTDWNGTDIVFKAILSDSIEDAKIRLAIPGPVYNSIGQLIADDGEDMFDGNLYTGILTDEFGTVSSGPVWTGTSPGGLYSGTACGDWIDNSSIVNFGISSRSTQDWLDFAEASCGQPGRIYCIQQ